LEESEQEKHESQSLFHAATCRVSSGVAIRLSRLIIGNLDERAAQLSQDDVEEREAVSLLGLRLTPCHWRIIRLLLAHPLLSDEELAALLGLERKSVRCSLYELHQLACLESVVTTAGKRWHLCERGLRLIAASHHMHIRTIAETMNVRDLTIKFSSYAYYIASREWAREISLLPVLVCIAPDVAQERRMVRVAKACLTCTRGLVVWTTTEVLLHEHGPQASIWLKDSHLLPKASQQIGSLRSCLFCTAFPKQESVIPHE
jgi:hypothetical protein